MARKRSSADALYKRASDNSLLLIGIVVVLGLWYYSRGYGGIKNMLMSLLPRREVPVPVAVIGDRRRVNVRSRGRLGPWRNIGIAHSESQEDDTVFSLWGREVDPRRSRYNYQVRDRETGININLNGGDAMDMLDSGDTVDIVGKESLGQFIVELNKPEELMYL